MGVSKDVNINLPTENYKCQFNTEIPIAAIASERVELKNEWDTDEMCRIFEEKKRVMVRADLPGSGKSYACEQMKERGHKVLFVCPTNKLVQKYKEDGITLNKFFSIGVSSKTKMAKFDDSSYDVVVFDEIYFYDIPKFARVKQYCQEHPEKTVIATGDTSQLPPINKLSNRFQHAPYADDCINQIFAHEVFLHENKRLKSDTDKQKLKQIKTDIFNKDIPLEVTIEKYFKFTTTVTQSEKNIAYMNDTCTEVAQHIRNLQNREAEYEVGEVLICREYFKTKQITFNVNFEYEIMSVGSKSLEVRSVCSQEIFTVSIKLIRSHFIFNYCGTAHSQQGASIDASITIFDYKHFFVSREWLWVAITRATELDNVFFYDYTFDSDLNEKLIRSYFARKIKGYKSQDREAQRQISKDKYVDVDWFMDAVGCGCCRCGCDFFIQFDTGNTNTNITADRIDSYLDHNLDNIQPMCRYCNACKSDNDEE